MKTLNAEWEKYRNACYPKGCGPHQARETHQAFIAGAFMALKLQLEACDCADTKEAEIAAGRQLEKIMEEATGFLRARGESLLAAMN